MKKVKRVFTEFRYLTLAAFFCLTLIAGLSFFLYLQKQPLLSSEVLASNVLTACQGEKYKPTCYDKEISSLMDQPFRLSMEDSFKVSSIILRNTQDYGFCHVLGHKLAAKETQKNPDRWKEVITRCPPGICSNGCIHGAFQERFRYEHLSSEQIEKIKPELKLICRKRDEWSPTGIEQGSCYHALGHLLMYMSNADIPKSVGLCKELAVNESGSSFIHVCLDGVFMQLFQPLETEDFSLIKGKVPDKNQLETFCGQFDNEAGASCWNESWPLFMPEIKQASGVMELCSKIDNRYQSRCFTSMFYIMPVQFRFDLNRSFDFCAGFGGDLRGSCFAQVGQRLVQTDYSYIDKAMDFCARAVPLDENEVCYRELAIKSKFNFPPQSPVHKEFCSKLPEKWQTLCK